jgi:hypothetical protein
MGRKGRADFEEDCEKRRKCLPRHTARTEDALRMLRSSLRLRARVTRLLVFEGGTKRGRAKPRSPEILRLPLPGLLATNEARNRESRPPMTAGDYPVVEFRSAQSSAVNAK